MATENEQVREDGGGSIQQTSLAAEDQMVDIYLMKDDGSRGSWSWQLKRSCLIQHSGFFQAMFRHEFREAIENVVELYDDDAFLLDDLMACVQKGTWGLPDGPVDGTITEDCAMPAHFEHLQHLNICDKYDMAEFKKQIFASMSGILPPLVRDWLSREISEGAFFELIWGPATRNNFGEFPEELYPGFANAWAMFQAHDDKTPRMDAEVEADRKLAAGVARAFRDMAWQNSKDTVSETEAAPETEQGNDEVDGFMGPDVDLVLPADLDRFISSLRLRE